MSRYYLGIDGGQSSTTALIADDTGLVVGHGYGGPCNHTGKAEGRAKFFSAIGESIEGACREAGLDPKAVVFASACLGFSGGAEDKEVYSRELIRSLKYKITHDAEIALSGATSGAPGIIVIAGTGSMAFGANAERKMARAGGWGYIFGDEGGAFDLTRRALRAALQFEEGWGPPTALHAQLLEATGARDANDLLHRFYAGIPRSAVASFAPLVDRASGMGDDVARGILAEAAAKLAWFVEGVYRQLFESEIIPVVPIGGVFHSERLRAEFAQCIQRSLGCPTQAPQMSPAAGALLEALRLDENLAPLSELVN